MLNFVHDSKSSVMNTSFFRLYIVLSVILLCCPTPAAQILENDSTLLSVPGDTLNTSGSIMSSPLFQKSDYIPQNYKYSPELSGGKLPSIEFEIPKFTPGKADVCSWGTGVFTAFGNIDSYPGLMSVESGGVTFGQRFGKFDINLDATVTKYGYFRGLSKSYGFGGALTYNINNRLSFTLQGAYHANPGLYQPAMFEIAPNSSVSGLLDYKINDKWGVLFGAVTYHSLASGHWDVRPVAQPYYMLGGVVPIGIDVGGIVFEILRNAIENGARSNSDRGYNINGGSNPTIAPPMPAPGTYPMRPK